MIYLRWYELAQEMRQLFAAKFSTPSTKHDAPVRSNSDFEFSNFSVAIFWGVANRVTGAPHMILPRASP